nr:hypothetical protein [uncultured Pedobacter sp.]
MRKKSYNGLGLKNQWKTLSFVYDEVNVAPKSWEAWTVMPS